MSEPWVISKIPHRETKFMKKMATRIFALIIGIDDYKSGRIWNLESCADDARRMSQWLTQDLHVPKDQISMLLNKDATKRQIEDTFMAHLVNNPDIVQGDAIVVYFAGHGSSIRPPRDWCEGTASDVQVLCPYDHDSKGPEGRVAGISDRSLTAMLEELARTKGDNITLILDCCFSSSQLSSNARDRRYIRCTPTAKATPEDLFAGLWKGARGQTFKGGFGFYRDDVEHTLLAACGVGEKAIEGKEGGKFTLEFLELTKTIPLHQIRSVDLPERIATSLGRGHHQHPVCMGKYKSRVIFGGVPFVPDTQFVPIDGEKDCLRLEMGAIHGVVEGTEFSVHGHNRRGSINPSLDSCRVYEVHPTWSLARRKSLSKPAGRGSWARITRWNNRTPFRVYVKRTCSSFFRRFICGYKSSAEEMDTLPVDKGFNIVRVESSTMADISVGVHTRDVRVENLDHLVPASTHPIVSIDRSTEKSNVILDEAARFHMHLHRTNPEKPFRDSVKMELFRVDPKTKSRVGQNLLKNGEVNLTQVQGASYAVVLQNHSDTDLWPYLAYMDSNGVDIGLLYHPNPS
ncbi:caspase domain-containing protein, partial [Hygrophoropsis aurantiaca]